VSDELKREMKKLRHVNWSSVARKAFEETIHMEKRRQAAREIDRIRESGKHTFKQ